MSKDSPVWQNIESELQNRSDEYIELREKWSIDFLRVIESDEEKIETFNEKVLPCLANQVILPSFSKSKKRWICLFDNCKLKKTSFIFLQLLSNYIFKLFKQDFFYFFIFFFF